MAGTFAHITAVSSLYGDPARLDQLADEHAYAISCNSRFCELGAISPDLPYLKIADPKAAYWSDGMHKDKTGDFVRAAIPLAAALPDGPEKRDCIAWLFGFTSHLVTDMTVHPVVNKKVGPYEENKREHRLCEMNQDAFILMDVLGQEITAAELIKNGLGQCAAEKDGLPPMLVTLWKETFERAGMTPSDNTPEPNEWFEAFVWMHDKIAEEGAVFWPVRGLMEWAAFAYPKSQSADETFLRNLKTPLGKSWDYRDVFRLAVENVFAAWLELDKALVAKDATLFTLPNGSLDTGKAEAEWIFWEGGQ